MNKIWIYVKSILIPVIVGGVVRIYNIWIYGL